ncbi:hypothetical protein LY78DRAFT_33098 [Colletotrichum sublineola]|nr:hypothetical protein LY78DRAFT_33098 [Colletotrichum sublineola]
MDGWLVDKEGRGPEAPGGGYERRDSRTKSDNHYPALAVFNQKGKTQKDHQPIPGCGLLVGLTTSFGGGAESSLPMADTPNVVSPPTLPLKVAVVTDWLFARVREKDCTYVVNGGAPRGFVSDLSSPGGSTLYLKHEADFGWVEWTNSRMPPATVTSHPVFDSDRDSTPYLFGRRHHVRPAVRVGGRQPTQSMSGKATLGVGKARSRHYNRKRREERPKLNRCRQHVGFGDAFLGQSVCCLRRGHADSV